jgi:tungstate transport system substrate-binding protein
LIRKLITALLVLLPTALPAAADSPLRLATTTTTVASGLMDYLLPKFTAATGIAVQMTAVGTGQALRLAQNGDVDVVLVHARDAEDAFVDAGHGVDRADVMVNDFVIVGPSSDPAGIAAAASATDALARIARDGEIFVSRGDESGTHRREMKLWRDGGLEPGGGWYRAVGLGMGRTLQIADQMNAYTLTDRGTWLALRERLQLALLFEADPPLSNPYGIIAVNPARYEHVNYTAAGALIEWITSPAAQQAIADFRIGGRSLFEPAAKPAP